MCEEKVEVEVEGGGEEKVVLIKYPQPPDPLPPFPPKCNTPYKHPYNQITHRTDDHLDIGWGILFRTTHLLSWTRVITHMCILKKVMGFCCGCY